MASGAWVRLKSKGDKSRHSSQEEPLSACILLEAEAAKAGVVAHHCQYTAHLWGQSFWGSLLSLLLEIFARALVSYRGLQG